MNLYTPKSMRYNSGVIALPVWLYSTPAQDAIFMLSKLPYTVM